MAGVAPDSEPEVMLVIEPTEPDATLVLNPVSTLTPAAESARTPTQFESMTEPVSDVSSKTRRESLSDFLNGLIYSMVWELLSGLLPGLHAWIVMFGELPEPKGMGPPSRMFFGSGGAPEKHCWRGGSVTPLPKAARAKRSSAHGQAARIQWRGTAQAHSGMRLISCRLFRI